MYIQSQAILALHEEVNEDFYNDNHDANGDDDDKEDDNEDDENVGNENGPMRQQNSI